MVPASVTAAPEGVTEETISQRWAADASGEEVGAMAMGASPATFLSLLL
jgi:hypothetical protein